MDNNHLSIGQSSIGDPRAENADLEKALRHAATACEGDYVPTGKGEAAISDLLLRAAAIVNSHDDMLAALKDCLPLFEHVACGEAQERVRAAIAKAER